MDLFSIARRVAFRYEQKESKKHKVARLAKAIREATGISKGLAADIADAVIRGRNVDALAMQKGWPLNDRGEVEGSRGSLSFDRIRLLLG